MFQKNSALSRYMSGLFLWLVVAAYAHAQLVQGELYPEAFQNPPVAISGRAEYVVLGSPQSAAFNPGRVFMYVSGDPYGDVGCWNLANILICPPVFGLSNFGRALAISADSTVLAAACSDVGIVFGMDTGAVVMHTRNPITGGFIMRQIIRNPIPALSYFQNFGTSLALSASGDYLIVGAPAGSDDMLGYAFIFGRKPLGCGCTPLVDYWYLHTFLYGTRPGQACLFGAAVGISAQAEYAAIGEPGADSAPSPYWEGRGAGRVYVYQRTAQTWRPDPVILHPDFPHSNNGLGTALALSGNGKTIVAGAPYDLTPDAAHVASVYIFERTGDVWNKSFRFDASQPGTNLGMAVEVSYDGKYALAIDSATIYCFQKTQPVSWQLVGQLPRAFLSDYGQSPDTVPTTKAIGLSAYSNFLVAGSGVTNDAVLYHPTCSLIVTNTSCPQQIVE